MQKDTPIHLVLGSGGARGLAHIGVVKVLKERGYRIETERGRGGGLQLDPYSVVTEVPLAPAAGMVFPGKLSQ